MRIGVNCLGTHPGYAGGTTSFTLGLLDGFSHVGAAHQFKIFVQPWNRELFERYEAVPHFELVELGGADDRRVLRAIRRRLPPRLRQRISIDDRSDLTRYTDAISRAVDVVYVPYVPPPRDFPCPDAPTVYSLHDIQHVHFPEFFDEEELLVREEAFARCVEHAAAVQASSRAMRDEFCDYFAKLDESNVAVIPEGVDIDLLSRRRADYDVRERYGLPASFLFTPAQLWHHKNHLTILRALKRLKERGLLLPWVLTGAEYTAAPGIFEFIESNGLAEQVRYLGVVPFDDVIALHQSARLLVTASLSESSSLPILEAAAAGTPIVAGRIPAHEEMAEHLEMRLFMPTDDEELARVLEEAWADEEMNNAQVAANGEGVKRYSWDNAARMYIELFERIRSEARLPAGLPS
jgi:glycosyltransferase involved in cell wall biosynthesis